MADLYYYESGYFDPELGYFVYTADAGAAIASSSSLTASASVIRSGASAMSSTFTASTTISHIEGADLFAFSSAQMSITVSRLRNNNVQVTSAFTQTVTGSKFLYFSSSQTSAATVVADNSRVRYGQAATSAAFSLAITGIVTKSVVSNQNSNFTLTANAGKQISITASLSSAFATSTFATEWVNSGPHIFTRTGDVGTTNVVKKFGTGSFRINGANAYASSPDSNDWDITSKTWSLDFWIYPTAWPSANRPILGQRTTTSLAASESGWGVFLNQSGTLTLSIDALQGSPVPNEVNINITSNITLNQWNHVRFESNGTRNVSYTNGTLEFNALIPANTSYVQGILPFKIGNATANSLPELFIDALDFQPGVMLDPTIPATITVPTGERSSPTAYSKLLMNFNGEIFDLSAAGVKTAAANLTSTATLNAVAGKASVGQANLSSSSSVTAIIGKITPATASLQATASELVAIGRIRPFISIEQAAATLSASGQVARSATISMASTASLSADITKNIGAITSSLTSTATLSAVGQITSGVTANLEAFATEVVAIGRIRPFISLEDTAFTLTASYQVVKVANASLSSSSAVSCVGTRNIGAIIAGLSSSASMTVQAKAIPAGSINASSAFSLSATANRIRGITDTPSSAFALSLTARVTRTTSVDLNSTASLTVNAYKIKQFSSQLSAFASELAVVVKVGRTLVHFDSAFSLAITTKVIKPNSIALSLTGTLTVTQSKVNKTFASAQSSTSTLSALAYSGKIGGAALQSTATVSAQSRKSAVGQSTLTSQFTVVARTSAIDQGISLQMSSGTLNITGRVLRGLTSSQTSRATLSVLGGRRVNLQANLSCQGFILAVGQVINLDASATYIVPRETRSWMIPYETRQYQVNYETRSYFIKKD